MTAIKRRVLHVDSACLIPIKCISQFVDNCKYVAPASFIIPLGRVGEKGGKEEVDKRKKYIEWNKKQTKKNEMCIQADEKNEIRKIREKCRENMNGEKGEKERQGG